LTLALAETFTTHKPEPKDNCIMKLLSRHPWILSLLIILALAGWLGSGMLQAEESAEAEIADTAENIIPRVRVRQIAAQTVTRTLTLYGRSEPARSVEIRSQLDGHIAEVMVKRGQTVKQGQTLARLELYDRPQQLDHARALLAQRELEYQSSKSLNQKGYQGKAKLAQAKAELKQAEARLTQLQLEIENTRIKAPFSGIINERNIEAGNYISRGEKLATLLEMNPIIVRGDASQQDRPQLFDGQTALVRFSNGITRSGKLRYLSAMSSRQTNTFRIEVALQNSGNKILAGISAEIDIPLQQVQAIKISPALFSLDEKGVIGVKWVRDNHVQFTPIKVVKTEADGVWISGIEPNAHIITVGQAFVKAGDQVEALTQDEEKS
jgi:multidrug efflux system membrane fusion protein